MPKILGRLQVAACLDSEPAFSDPVLRWRMHKKLRREASRVVRDKKALAGGDAAAAGGRHELRMLAIARASWTQDDHTFQLLRRHWDGFDRHFEASGDGCRLARPALFEQQLAAAMLGVAAKRSQRAGRESRTAHDLAASPPLSAVVGGARGGQRRRRCRPSCQQ